jgi:glycosyltransferase involved in cell wall biosynthesis
LPLTVLSVGYPLAKISRSTAGGAEQILLTLDKGLVASGDRSLVLAPRGSRCYGLLVPVSTPTVNFDEKTKREAQSKFQDSLDRVLERYQVEVVHMHGVDFDRYLPRLKIPIVVSLHLPLAWYRQKALYERCPNLSLVAVSHTQARSAPHEVSITATIPNGIELEAFAGSRRQGTYALILGRICPEKGVHLALEAAQRARMPVILAGTVFDYPEHQEYFQEMVRPRLSSKVRFIGAVGGKRKAHLLAGAQCLLVASLAPETSCLVAMEALASGTAVVGWRSGALPEIVRHGSTGFVVASVAEMADAIEAIGCIEPDCCRSEAERRFSSQAMVSGYRALYRELVSDRTALELKAA